MCPETLSLNGHELFKTLTQKRDHSGSAEDEYAQLLFTMYMNVGDGLFPLLEQAEQQNKKLYLIPDEEHPHLNISFYNKKDIGLK